MSIDTLNQWSEVWINFMTSRLIDSTIVFALLGGIWLLIRHRVSAQFGYLLFLLVLVKLAVPSQISIPDLISSYFPLHEEVQKKFSFDCIGVV